MAEKENYVIRVEGNVVEVSPEVYYEEQGFPQEVQHQRDYYPQPQYPEPQYPDWVNDCDDGMLPMEMGGM